MKEGSVQMGKWRIPPDVDRGLVNRNRYTYHFQNEAAGLQKSGVVWRTRIPQDMQRDINGRAVEDSQCRLQQCSPKTGISAASSDEDARPLPAAASCRRTSLFFADGLHH